MTLEQLAALPEGTKVRLWMDAYTEIGDESIDVYDYGVVLGAGAIVRIEWGGDYDATSLIDTKSKTWEPFVKDIDEDPNQ
jgi:hypothetical protein